ncbi:MAG: phosphotransferase [Rhodopila sp.]
MSALQQAVIDFLSDPASYGRPDARVERVETHCSIVFLVADGAYKLKRAIRFASLDYTTVERRRAACESELRLNARTAPDLYLAVRAITCGVDGTLAFDGTSPALDHVVVMRRFAQSALFDCMAEAGQLTPPLMRDLGTTIARFHADAPVVRTLGGSDGTRRMIADNDRKLARVGATLDGAPVATLGVRTRETLGRIADLLDVRRAEGRVRRCHGDLRLANICLFANRPTLFDCIEFDEDIGSIDVLYDLAFLLMDLHLRGRGDLGNVVLNAYLDRTHETGGLRVMPLFLSLRAATRSYALATAAGRRADANEARALVAQARRHIAAALGFLDVRAPVLILLGGDDRDRAETAASLAARVAPPPGARALHAERGGVARSPGGAGGRLPGPAGRPVHRQRRMHCHRRPAAGRWPAGVLARLPAAWPGPADLADRAGRPGWDRGWDRSHGRSGEVRCSSVVAGFGPAIHVFAAISTARRGWPGQAQPRH